MRRLREAHPSVDHGKTTLMDKLMRECDGESSHAGGGEASSERAMDSMSLERERGITIQAKYTSMLWRGCTLNAVDTPGHADFGGEVRVEGGTAPCRPATPTEARLRLAGGAGAGNGGWCSPVGGRG